jgi:hypothetical protein
VRLVANEDAILLIVEAGLAATVEAILLIVANEEVVLLIG